MRRSPEPRRQPDPDSPTRKQQAFLDRHNLCPEQPIDYHEAAHVIGRFVHDRRQLSPTERQKEFLKAQGQWRDGMSRGEAFDLIRRIKLGFGGPD
jgi:hypothetical protein